MLGSLFLALGIVTCTAAGGHCDSPSTQLRRDPPTRPAVTVTDSTDAADQKMFEQNRDTSSADHR
jgi:hypothetical protein